MSLNKIQGRMRQYDTAITDMEKSVEIGENLIKLRNNPEWQKFYADYTDYTLKSQTSRLVIMADPEERKRVMNAIESIGYFMNFIEGHTDELEDIKLTMEQHKEESVKLAKLEAEELAQAEQALDS